MELSNIINYTKSVKEIFPDAKLSEIIEYLIEFVEDEIIANDLTLNSKLYYELKAIILLILHYYFVNINDNDKISDEDKKEFYNMILALNHLLGLYVLTVTKEKEREEIALVFLMNIINILKLIKSFLLGLNIENERMDKTIEEALKFYPHLDLWGLKEVQHILQSFSDLKSVVDTLENT